MKSRAILFACEISLSRDKTNARRLRRSAESRVRKRRDGHVKLAGQPAQDGFQFKHDVLIKIGRRGVHGRHGVFHQQDSICLRLADPPIQLVIALAQGLKELLGLNYRGSSHQRTPHIGRRSSSLGLWMLRHARSCRWNNKKLPILHAAHGKTGGLQNHTFRYRALRIVTSLSKQWPWAGVLTNSKKKA
jgi:hypothetical protein